MKVYFYDVNNNIEHIYMFDEKRSVIDGIHMTFETFINNEKRSYKCKMINGDWWLHDSESWSYRYEGNYVCYFFHNNGKICRIEDMDADDETKMFLKLKYTQKDENPWYE